MSQAGGGEQRQGAQHNLAMALTGLLGQVGCVTSIIILVALGAGLWIDRVLDSRPVFTLLLMLGSVPVTIYLMIRIVLAGTSRLQPGPDSAPPEAEEEDEIERRA